MARIGDRVAELRLSTLADSIAVRLLLAVMDPSVEVSTRLDDTVLPGLALLRLSGGDAAAAEAVVAVVGDDGAAFDRATWAFADAVGADVVYFLPRHTDELTELFGPPAAVEPLDAVDAVEPLDAVDAVEPLDSGPERRTDVCRCGIRTSSQAQSQQAAPR